MTLGSLDSQPIGQARRLLLTVTGRSASTDMEWNDTRTSLTKWGKAPAQIEVVQGKVLLTSMEGAEALAARPLDATGQSQGHPIAARRETSGEMWALPLGGTTTTW